MSSSQTLYQGNSPFAKSLEGECQQWLAWAGALPGSVCTEHQVWAGKNVIIAAGTPVQEVVTVPQATGAHLASQLASRTLVQVSPLSVFWLRRPIFWLEIWLSRYWVRMIGTPSASLLLGILCLSVTHSFRHSSYYLRMLNPLWRKIWV